MHAHAHEQEQVTLLGARVFGGALVNDGCGSWVLTSNDREDLLVAIESRDNALCEKEW